MAQTGRAQARLGVDIGGTFTDVALEVRGQRHSAKVLTTPEAPERAVITAIRTVLGGDVYVSEKWKEKLVNMFGKWGPSVAGPSAEKLSDREMEVLQLIGQAYSTQKIAEELHVSGKTIESHYANIKNKLDLKNSHELIQYAVQWRLSEK